MLKKNILSILVAFIILYLSLANAKTFNNVPFINIPHFDKVVHFCMFFGLTAVLFFENRKSLKSTGRLLLVAFISFMYGVLMEVLQTTLTLTRTGDVFDALADLTGVITLLLLWIWIKPFKPREIR